MIKEIFKGIKTGAKEVRNFAREMSQNIKDQNRESRINAANNLNEYGITAQEYKTWTRYELISYIVCFNIIKDCLSWDELQRFEKRLMSLKKVKENELCALDNMLIFTAQSMAASIIPFGMSDIDSNRSSWLGDKEIARLKKIRDNVMNLSLGNDYSVRAIPLWYIDPENSKHLEEERSYGYEKFMAKWMKTK